MRKTILSVITFFLCVPIFCSAAFSAPEDTVRVGLYYSGSSSYDALISANLENHTGSGYTFGYYDTERSFVPLGTTDVTTISMSQDKNLYIKSDGSYAAEGNEGEAVIGCYHLQLSAAYASYEEAAAAAAEYKIVYGTAFPAYDCGSFVVRVGNCASSAQANELLRSSGLSASITSGTAYTVTVTRTKTNEILFEYDDGGATFLAIEPISVDGEKCQTWFKGYRYYGGFEYDRSAELSNGKINVINVINIEDYVKGVITFEMSPSWPQEALKAQAICARTYVLNQSKHDSKGFDVCATTNCQVYRGTASSKENSDTAVDETAGMAIYYANKLIDPSYYSSNGGASEDSENVWTAAQPYTRGKIDPYEATMNIPGYSYEATYTAAELTNLLQKKGYSIGTVVSVQPEYTALGNIYSITFTDGKGNSVLVKKENCKLLIPVAKSMHFTISGESASGASNQTGTAISSGDGTYYVNGVGSILSKICGLFAISGRGIVSQYNGDSIYVLTASGKQLLGEAGQGGQETTGGGAENGIVYTGNVYTVRGSGSGHNVGMSQYGAYTMAKLGMSYRDILQFYYTDIEIK